jgi:hypothetical protein
MGTVKQEKNYFFLVYNFTCFRMDELTQKKIYDNLKISKDLLWGLVPTWHWKLNRQKVTKEEEWPETINKIYHNLLTRRLSFAMCKNR